MAWMSCLKKLECGISEYPPPKIQHAPFHPHDANFMIESIVIELTGTEGNILLKIFNMTAESLS